MPQAIFVAKKNLGTALARTESIPNNLIAYLSTDQNTTDTNSYPVASPRDPTFDNYSYENWIHYFCTVAPTNQVTNFTFYGPNIQPDGDQINPKLTIFAATSGVAITPIQTQITLPGAVAQHSNYFDPSNKLDITINESDNKIDAVGEKTHYLILQLRVETSAPTGEIDLQTYTIEYDES